MKPHDVTCPTCGVAPGALCITDEGHAVNVAHPDRVVAARTETFAELRDPAPHYRGAWRDQRTESRRMVDEANAQDMSGLGWYPPGGETPKPRGAA